MGGFWCGKGVGFGYTGDGTVTRLDIPRWTEWCLKACMRRRDSNNKIFIRFTVHEEDNV